MVIGHKAAGRRGGQKAQVCGSVVWAVWAGVEQGGMVEQLGRGRRLVKGRVPAWECMYGIPMGMWGWGGEGRVGCGRWKGYVCVWLQAREGGKGVVCIRIRTRAGASGKAPGKGRTVWGYGQGRVAR